MSRTHSLRLRHVMLFLQLESRDVPSFLPPVPYIIGQSPLPRRNGGSE